MLSVVKNNIPNQPLKLVNNPNAAEFFADELRGISHVNGSCELTFAEVKADHSQAPAPNYSRVSGSVRTTLPGLIHIHEGIGRMIEELKKQGAIMPVTKPPLQPIQ